MYPTFGKSPIASPGLFSCAIVKAQALPKMTISNNELAPSLLAPCTLVHPASPQA